MCAPTIYVRYDIWGTSVYVRMHAGTENEDPNRCERKFLQVFFNSVTKTFENIWIDRAQVS
jgi:hypothetical protein